MEPSRDDHQTLDEEQPLAAAAAVEAVEVEEEDEGEESSNEEDAIVAKAQVLMDKITSSPDNPSSDALHALSSILETQESRYMEEMGHSSLNNARGSHSIGRLGNLIRENDEFFELVSEKFLSESKDPISVQAATTRLLFSCSLTWMYPHVFEDNILENLKAWAMEETSRPSGEVQNLRHEPGRKKSTDAEMLRTYSTGLLAICLAGGGPVVEDVLTSGLSAKLMRYLRFRVLGETSQKEAHHVTESKNVSSANSLRGRDEGRGKFRQLQENSRIEGPKLLEEGALDNHGVELCEDRIQAHAEERLFHGGEPPDGQADLFMSEEVDVNAEDRRQNLDSRDGRTKFNEKSNPARTGRSRGKGKLNECIPENEQALNSPGSVIRPGPYGRGNKDRVLNKYSDMKRVVDSKKGSDNFVLEREDDDECFHDCKVGSKDISDLVKKAVQAAKAEAKAANAPAEAVKAVGDAAVEVVKTAALEELKKTNDEDAAVLAASRAASTVVDAANAVEVSRSAAGTQDDSVNLKETEPDSKEVEEFFILDSDSLAKLREKFCIQCLVFLGEYVEVLSPVMREKGVDVCLALLQRSSKDTEASKIAMFLPDVLKLICTLAAHKKFALGFVERGGIQRLLSVPRVSQTFLGLSSCLFAIGSLQVIMERVCGLAPVHQVVELALQLLVCPQDQARKNAALFLSNAFVFRAVLDYFDVQDGLQKSLGILHDAASVRAGVNVGALASSSLGSRSPSEVLTSSEKQIAYHTCIALRQYFRAHLVLLVDSNFPSKNRNALRNIINVRPAYKPFDISNEAMDAIFQQIQKDRKLGPAIVRARWPAVDKFLAYNGHIIMLELCQAPTVDRYLHDLLQYALGILFIVTLVPHSRKPVVNATLSNDRVGISVILDAANGAGFVDPEITQPALNVLVNLVCPPPSISNKPAMFSQGQQPASVQTSNGSTVQNELRDRNGESSVLDRSCATSVSNTPQTLVASGLVGDRRISLGAGAGCAGLAAQLEQGYRQAREAVRANNGIKVLLQLLQPRIVTPPASLDCLRALACRVLLGLARDDTIAHILTKLQVGKKLSELIRDSGNQTPGNESGRWQAELGQVAIELIAIVTNSGRASTLAASDAATSTLRRIERAAIAAATPITYHSRELLLLIHEHLQASGLSETAGTLLKEAELAPLPPSAGVSSQVHHSSVQETPSIQIQWPSGRLPSGFFPNNSKKLILRDNDPGSKYDADLSSLKKKPLSLSSVKSFSSRTHPQMLDSPPVSSSKTGSTSKVPFVHSGTLEPPLNSNSDMETQLRTPIILPLKRKFTDLKDVVPSAKRLNTSEHGLRSPLCLTPNSARKSSQLTDASVLCSPSFSMKDHYARLIPNTGASEQLDENQSDTQLGILSDSQNTHQERLTLDSLVVQYLKHQHRQCPAPITTLPPLSLLHPHVCPEPRRCIDAPSNITARLTTREFRSMYGGIHGNRQDRHFVFSRFRPWRTCRDDVGGLLTCITFLGDSSQIVAGSHAGELKVFDSNTNNMLESCSSHQYPLTLVQSHISNETQLILSSSTHDVRLWDATSVSGGPKHSFEGCKSATFSRSGSAFAALPNEGTRREILLYDIETCRLDLKLADTSGTTSSRGSIYSLVHCSPSDNMLLWNGVLWDRRSSNPLHRFDQFTDYGGGGFHPAGNEVIINSEVWDLRKFQLLRSVPSLDQTVITFNASGDVIYAILRRNLDDVMSAFNTRRVKHPLFSAFRTIDAVSYSDIATVPVDRCVLDFSADSTDSFVGLVTMDDQSDMYSSARVYEIGRRRPTDDDSDPDDAETEEEEDEDDDDMEDDDSLLGALDGDGDSDVDDMSNEDDDDGFSDLDDDDEDGDFMDNEGGFGGGGFLEIVADGDEGDDSDEVDSLSSGDEDFAGFPF